MLIRIRKTLTCTNSTQCANEILSKIETLTGIKLHAITDTEKTEGYISIVHKQNDHFILVCIYNTNMHEVVDVKEFKEFEKGNMRQFALEKYSSDRLQKWLGAIPTKQQIEAIL